MNAPRISVGLPVFNGEAHVASAIDSVLGQSFEDFDLIICDNASTDGTQSICRSYAENDPRVRYFRSDENVGSVRNFNLAYSYSASPYFKWAAADDLIAPTFLEKCLQVLEADQGVSLATSRVSLIDSRGVPQDFDDAFRAWVTAAGGQYRENGKVARLNSGKPTERFTDVVLRKRYYHEIYGLIRSSDLERTSLHRPFVGSDKVLLSELSLLGRFETVDEELFYSRIYLGEPTLYRSKNLAMATDPDWVEPRIYIPEARLAKEYFKVARSYPGSLADRLTCMWAVVRKVLQPDKIAKLIVPGRSNYLGFGAKGAEIP